MMAYPAEIAQNVQAEPVDSEASEDGEGGGV